MANETWACKFRSSYLPGLTLFYKYDKILSHIPMHTGSRSPCISSLSANSIPNRYSCKITVINAG